MKKTALTAALLIALPCGAPAQELSRGDRVAAIAAFDKLAKDGSVGNRSAGGIDPLLGDLPDDPRMQPVIKRFDANLATQNATLKRLRASGMSVEAARREYVAGLSH